MAAADPGETPSANRLAAESLAAGDPTGWFERLYVATAEAGTAPPWSSDEPHALLVQWAHERGVVGEGRRAIVVGCGLGADAELVADLGFATVAFDISETAVATARERSRHPGTEYRTADLLELPPAWRGAFDLVVEIYTVQALPDPPRAAAIAAVSSLVAPGGTLLVVAFAAHDEEPADGPPWPLTRAEVDAFAAGGALAPVSVEQLPESGPPDERRWRAELRAP